MRVINPIYDVAFKYLLEDREIARKLIAKIIGEEVERLEMQPQEFTSQVEKFGILILRLDFKATIKTAAGEYKTVLIELQKAKMYEDLMRFRRYIAENYRKEVDVLKDNGQTEQMALPITTIYFLGFSLPRINTSILKVNREYVDLITGQKLDVKTEFVEKLTHDSYVIVIPELPSEERTELEGILQVFNQSFRFSGDSRLLEIEESEFAEQALTLEIVDRLRRGATDGKVLRDMEIEEEVVETIERHIREKEAVQERAHREIKARDEQLKSSQEEIKARDEQLKSSQEEIKAKDEKLKEQQRMLEELRRRLKDDEE